MIRRNALDKLIKWREDPQRKPLILRGARQVGKTTLVNLFSEYYETYLYFNLDKQEDRQYFENYSSIEVLIQRLLLARNKRKGTSQILLFIDEIQEIPELIGGLRYFYEEQDSIDLIAAGSLLEHVLGNIESFPVGRVNFLMLYPLNFEEYLNARQLELVGEHLKKIPLDPIAEPLLYEEFHRFALIGGMPEIVRKYAQTLDISSCKRLYDDLLYAYQSDVLKYAGNLKGVNVLNHIIINAASQANNRISFAGFANSSYRSQEVKNAMELLEKSKILYLLYPTNDVTPPALPNQKVMPRLQYLDTGLMNYSNEVQGELLQVEDLNDLYRGRIIQHIVTQELMSRNESAIFKPKFWIREKKTSNAEVDLLYQEGRYLVPIEVKAGKTGRLRSLMLFMDRTNHHYAVRLYKGPFQIQEAETLEGKKFTLMNLPYFLGCKLPEYIKYFVNNY